MPMEETNAFSALNQLMIPQNIVSPSKQQQQQQQEGVNPEKWMEILMKYSQLTNQQLPQMSQMPQMPQRPVQIPQMPQIPVVIQTSPTHSQGDQMLKASPSASSEMSSDSNDGAVDQYNKAPLQPIDSQVNIAANIVDQKSTSYDTWLECFTTTKLSEYEALLFSVYVTERADRKFDGWTHFDCLHRLQSKCRYRVRAKKQDEFFIVEEKGVHNHGAVEPVGQAGSHAGLPKTIREIVDRAYNECWPLEVRTAKVDDEIKRLGLPANPRLGRQIDNRIAYLRRVKNLSESRRMQDQVNGGLPVQASSSSPPSIDPMMLNPQFLQALMEQNGGSLTVEKGLVEQLLGPKAVAELAAAQQVQNPVQQVAMAEAKHDDMSPINNPDFLEFIQQQRMSHDQERQALLAQHGMAVSATQENLHPQ